MSLMIFLCAMHTRLRDHQERITQPWICMIKSLEMLVNMCHFYC